MTGMCVCEREREREREKEGREIEGREREREIVSNSVWFNNVGGRLVLWFGIVHSTIIVHFILVIHVYHSK